MANVTDISASTNTLGFIIGASSTQADCILDPRREYQLTHLSLEGDGTTASALTIMFGLATLADDVDFSPETYAKLPLKSGASLAIGPGIPRIYFDCASGNPTFLIQPRKELFGQY